MAPSCCTTITPKDDSFGEIRWRCQVFGWRHKKLSAKTQRSESYRWAISRGRQNFVPTRLPWLSWALNRLSREIPNPPAPNTAFFPQTGSNAFGLKRRRAGVGGRTWRNLYNS